MATTLSDILRKKAGKVKEDKGLTDLFATAASAPLHLKTSAELAPKDRKRKVEEPAPEDEQQEDDYESESETEKAMSASEDSDSDDDGDSVDVSDDESEFEVDSDDPADAPRTKKNKSSGEPVALDADVLAKIQELAGEISKMERTVFVGNLPMALTTKEFKTIFRQYGAVESVRFRSVARDPETKMPRKAAVIKHVVNEDRTSKNGYVVYADEAGARASLKHNAQLVGDNHVRVDMATGSPHDYQKTIFVGNLPFSVEEESLYEHFAEIGDLEAVRIVRDKFTNVGKGIAYVTFADAAVMTSALKLNGSTFMDRQIRVFRAKPDGGVKGGAKQRHEKRESQFEGTHAHKGDVPKMKRRKVAPAKEGHRDKKRKQQVRKQTKDRVMGNPQASSGHKFKNKAKH
eukprot:TRINITY_DN15747_c0_g1_i1.p1 TRINITY_DN15747_c0_g1~~TRINITY_DN15747_c0_g1_i1.p1  ORF type:complete len:403 (-),score=96.49 TRINITY_DN15747_c0_g1_i1:164-1372(-)